MSSSVFYRFKSQKDYSRISFDGSQLGLTAFDIKREIIQTEKLGTGVDFDLRISNADSNAEYSDDAETIPRGTSIIVQRKPPSRGPGKGSAARYVTGNAIQVSSRQEFKKPNIAQPSLAVGLPPPMPVPGSSEDEAIRAMLSASSDQWQQAQDRMALSRPVFRPGARGVPTGPVPDKPLPQGYICYRCGQKGHYIQACPTNGDDAFENRKRIKRTTGIPRSQLQKVEGSAEDGDGNLMVNAEGESVMFVPDSASWESYQKKTKLTREDEIPSDATISCALCKKLLKKPMSVPCCKHTFCEDCIQNALLESDFVCPMCGTKDILLDQLSEEPELEARVKDYNNARDLEETGNRVVEQVRQDAGIVTDTETPVSITVQTPVVQPDSNMNFDPMTMPFPPLPLGGMAPFPMLGFPPFPMPGMYGMPSLPGFPGMPGMPSLPGMPNMPKMPNMPGMPTRLGMANIPDMPSMPGQAFMPMMASISDDHLAHNKNRHATQHNRTKTNLGTNTSNQVANIADQAVNASHGTPANQGTKRPREKETKDIAS